MITFVCWKWRSPTYRTTYSAEHANVLSRMLGRHCSEEHRVICVTDDPEGVEECDTHPLWSDHDQLQNPNGSALPSCYRRLRVFDRATTRAMGVADGEWVFSVDLDVVVVGSMAALLDKGEDFVGWYGRGSFQPVVYSGSFFKFRAGSMQHLWDDFDPATSPRETKTARYYGSDQAWISCRLSGSRPGWDHGDGVYAYARDVRGRQLPANAVVVNFNGKRKPWEPSVMAEAPWIGEHWR